LHRDLGHTGERLCAPGVDREGDVAGHIDVRVTGDREVRADLDAAALVRLRARAPGERLRQRAHLHATSPDDGSRAEAGRAIGTLVCQALLVDVLHHHTGPNLDAEARQRI